jgi:hypothetical protein
MGSSIEFSDMRFEPAPDPLADVLLAVYDLRTDLLSHDFFIFLVMCEITRARGGFQSIVVNLVKDPGRGHRINSGVDYSAVVDDAARDWRLINMAVAFFQLFPTISGYRVYGSRAECDAALRAIARPENVFPPGSMAGQHYNMGLLNDASRTVFTEFGVHPDFVAPRAPAVGLEFAARWIQFHCGAKKVVTITLRQVGYATARNSNLDAWGRFIEWLPEDFMPVIIPDTDALYQDLPAAFKRALICSEASLNVGFRTALYELAYLNLAVNTGPKVMLKLNRKTRYVTFKFVVDGEHSASAAHIESLGHRVGEDSVFATKFQHHSWRNDDFDIIVEEFQRMCAIIESDGAEHAHKGDLRRY